MAVVTKTFFKVSTFTNGGDCVSHDVLYSVYDIFRAMAERKREIRLPNAPTALAGNKAIKNRNIILADVKVVFADDVTKIAEEDYETVFNGDDEGSEAEKEQHVDAFRKGFARFHKHGPAGSFHQFLSYRLPFDGRSKVFSFPYDAFDDLDAPSGLSALSKIFPEIFKGETPRECTLCVQHSPTSGTSLA